jgi:YidC/Oxa1 family membrane protein insertase
MLNNLLKFLKYLLKYYTGNLIKRSPVLSVYSLFLLLLLTTSQLQAEEYPPSPDVKTSRLHLDFSLEGANPTSLQSYYLPSTGRNKGEIYFIKTGDLPLIELCIKDNPLLQKRINQLTYNLAREENREEILLKFVSESSPDSIQFEKIYAIPKSNYAITFTLKVTGKNADTFCRNNSIGIVLRHGKSFVPPPSAGFSGSNQKVKAIVIRENTVSEISRNKRKPAVDTLRSSQWAGFRNNFWVILCRPLSNNALLSYNGIVIKNELSLSLTSGQKECSFQLFAGPIEHAALNNETVKLSGILFSGQWFWMRWLCFGLLFLLDWLIKIIGNHGLAIILLSVCVKILMLPLVKIADKWQREVNLKKSTLQPFINEIKASFRGEEQNKRILKLHREQGIHPLYTLKSLLSVIVQIPIFFAAYHMLDENLALSGVPFLWITDLALPDNLLQLPFRIPFFGEYLNLLPFLMTGITLMTSWWFKDNSLSKDLLVKQQRSLYWMALIFFILFYTFPAGMVLYWTTNNLLSLVKVLVLKTGERPLNPPKGDLK